MMLFFYLSFFSFEHSINSNDIFIILAIFLKNLNSFIYINRYKIDKHSDGIILLVKI